MAKKKVSHLENKMVITKVMVTKNHDFCYYHSNKKVEKCDAF